MKPLSRRTVLRGAAGFGLALPWLEAMFDNKARAQTAPPKRYLLGFAGCSLPRASCSTLRSALRALPSGARSSTSRACRAELRA